MMKPLQLLNSKKKKGVKTISMKTKIGYGEKDAISTAIENTTLDEGDIIITSDTEEMAFVKPDKNPMFIKSRSTKEYTLNGTDLGALSNGQSIPAGTSIDDLLNMITQKAVHPTYTAPTVSITKSGSGTASGSYETGTSITPILAATFNKNDAGDLTKLAILKGTEEVGSGATSPYTYTGDVFVLGDETITYKPILAVDAINKNINCIAREVGLGMDYSSSNSDPDGERKCEEFFEQQKINNPKYRLYIKK